MVSNDIAIEDCVETIIASLPVCKVRGVAYSTFSVIHMNSEGKGYLFEFDNPQAILVRDCKCRDFAREEMNVLGKTVYKTALDLKAGDIVVVNKKTATFLDDRAIVKRVIAVGGQSVDIDYASGTVYVDGSPLDEPYIKETMYFPASYTMSQTHWDVPEGQLFLMGDNRNGSTDSRDERLGPVDEGYVLGRAVLALWPLSKAGVL